MLHLWAMRIAFQTDPIEGLKPGIDNTLLIMQEACARGYEVYYFQPSSLKLDHSGIVEARVSKVHIDLLSEPFYALQPANIMDLSSMDVIFFRQDPPFDMDYITNTYLLERLRDDVVLVNDPYWIRNMPDKLSIFDYKDWLPPTLVTSDAGMIEEFYQSHGPDVILKPLYGFHGNGIERAKSFDCVMKIMGRASEPMMIQPFLPEIRQGNKRFVFFDGEMVGAICTIPDEDFRIYRDSSDHTYALSDEEHVFCDLLGKDLRERGLIFVGVDFIGPYLTEINVGSVASIVRLNALYGGQYEAKLLDRVIARVPSV